ncbi:protein GAMETE EXPRESSED 1 [Dorcoceras hygrometricum]|uniref:Protein GAMETE EXPRESSED 1 n=1 Tax=Dorcoceras hygrometricum TaxID=472368 RepID=A0A2Z7C3I1_9LAMI|nr:protein GAMETE EXPRESSED 1 [Dorcoceras hygrometricum]
MDDKKEDRYKQEDKSEERAVERSKERSKDRRMRTRSDKRPSRKHDRKVLVAEESTKSWADTDSESSSGSSSSSDSEQEEVHCLMADQTSDDELKIENDLLRNEASELKAEVLKLTKEMSSWNQSARALHKLQESLKSVNENLAWASVVVRAVKERQVLNHNQPMTSSIK